MFATPDTRRSHRLCQAWQSLCRSPDWHSSHPTLLSPYCSGCASGDSGYCSALGKARQSPPKPTAPTGRAGDAAARLADKPDISICPHRATVIPRELEGSKNLQSYLSRHPHLPMSPISPGKSHTRLLSVGWEMPARAHLLLRGRANTTGWPRLGAGRGEGRDTHPARRRRRKRRRVVCLAALVLMLEGTDRQAEDDQADHAGPLVPH